MAHEAEVEEAKNTIEKLESVRSDILNALDGKRSLLRDAGYSSLVGEAENLVEQLSREASRTRSWLNAYEDHPTDPSPPDDSPQVFQPAPSNGKGDIDGDGKVSLRDADLARGISLGNVKFDPAGDVTGDGTVNSRDGLAIAKYAKGEISTFPVNEPDESEPPEPDPPEEPPTNGQPAPASGLGDVDGDGRVTKRDAELVIDMATGKVARDPSADVDGDGDISSRDALMIARYAEGKMNSFPAEDSGSSSGLSGGPVTVSGST